MIRTKIRHLTAMEESRQFTYHALRNHCSVGPDHWDDGICKGCGKRRNTCVEQGLPNLCESCYRLLQIYNSIFCAKFFVAIYHFNNHVLFSSMMK